MHRKSCKRYDVTGDAHSLTFSCFNREPFLKDDAICEELIFYIDKARDIHGFDLWAYVIMPEHVHLLIWPGDRDYSISRILKTIKHPLSRKMISRFKGSNPPRIKMLETGESARPYRFWQAGGGFDRNINSQKLLKHVMEYIHLNPVRRGLVDRQEDWVWSSYSDWANMGLGKLRIDRESFPPG